ncbi:RhoGEF domain-containing protein gxcJ [Durusdinium trenchii]|uniref:RhoGEF domain-containing protein gxcJ n=1 Tax=Durusdinium trenchii TaxID=1381693 RepID=A0ABP0J8A5_9DINO
MTQDAQLVDWARFLRCGVNELAPPGRKLLFEATGLETPAAGGTMKKRKDVHMLVCSDVLVLSQMRKKSTFSRKKPELRWVQVVGLKFDKDPNVRLITLNPGGDDAFPLYCTSATVYEQVLNALSGVVAAISPASSGATASTKATDSADQGSGSGKSSASSATSSSTALGDGASGEAEEKSATSGTTPPAVPPISAIPTEGVPKKVIARHPSSDGPRKSADDEDALQMDGVKITAVFERMMMWAGAGATTVDEANASEARRAMSMANTERTRDQVQCIKVFREILDTERAYVQDMRKLVTEYITPLREASTKEGDKLISAEDLTLIFNNVENILKVNAELLQSLQVGVLRISRNGEIPSLCEVAGVFAKEFERVVPFFKMYWVYCHQYNAALDRVSSLRESNKELGNFLQRREARKKNQQASLQHLLIKPVQRICKYPLLFRELLNHMNKIAARRKEDTDFLQHVSELGHAEKEVQGIANMVNTKVSEAENQDQVMKVYLELGGESGCPGLVTPSRRFVRTEDVLMREAPFSENKRLRYRLYLFNDLIIFAKVQTGGTLGKVGTLGRATATGAISDIIGTLTLKGKSNLRVTHTFDLEQCKGVKVLNYIDEDNRHAFEIRRVSRVERVTKTGSLTSSSGGGASVPTRTTTQIQRFEVWCENKNIMDTLIGVIEGALEKLESNQGTRETAAPNRGKARAWASRTRTKTWRSSYTGSMKGAALDQALKEAAAAEKAADSSADADGATAKSSGAKTDGNGTTPETGSDDSKKAPAKSTSSASGVEQGAPSDPSAAAAAAAVAVVSGSGTSNSNTTTGNTGHTRKKSMEQQQLSLDNLKSRYEVAPRVKPDPKQGGTLKLEIEFPAGPLGLALENSKQPKGVLVACVAALSVAERGGLALGDRVVSVGGNAVPEDATWDQVVDIIKTLPRPLKIGFERTAETMAVGMNKKGKSGKAKVRKSSTDSAAPGSPASSTAGKSDRPASTAPAKSGAAAGPNNPAALSAAVHTATIASAAAAAVVATVEPVAVPADSKTSTKSSSSSSSASSSKSLASVQSSGSGTPSSSSSSKGTGRTGQRAWAQRVDRRKAAHGTTRLLSLKELEACYSSAENAVGASQSDEVEAVFKALEAKAEGDKVIKVMREILETEKKYVCDLRKLIGEYMLPLRQARTASNTQLLSSEDEQAIFLNVEGILKINAELLKNILEGILKTKSAPDLVQAVRVVTKELQDILPFLKIYATFCHRYSSALSKLVSCRQSNKALDQFMQQREGRSENQHSSLQSLLIKPVQRICKYPLLVSSLQKAVGDLLGSDADLHQELDRACKAVEAIAAEVNQKVNDAENMDKVLKVYQQLGGDAGCANLVEPHRRFVSKDDVHVLKAPFYEGKAQKQTAFLFNDVILLAEPRKRESTPESYKLVDRIDLRKCDVKPQTSVSEASFQVTQVTRNVTTSGKNGTTGGTAGGSGTDSKVSTCIQKFRVTCESKEAADRLLADISREIETLIDLDTSKRAVHPGAASGSLHSLGSTSMGGSGKFDSKRGDSLKKRTWNKRAGASKISLEDMENRYNSNASGSAAASAAPTS